MLISKRLRDKETTQWSKSGSNKKERFSCINEEAKVVSKEFTKVPIIFKKLENPHCPSSFEHTIWPHLKCPIVLHKFHAMHLTPFH